MVFVLAFKCNWNDLPKQVWSFVSNNFTENESQLNDFSTEVNFLTFQLECIVFVCVVTDYIWRGIISILNHFENEFICSGTQNTWGSIESLHMCLFLNVNEHCVRNLQIVLKYQLLAATGRRDIQNCNQLTKQKAVTNMKMARDPPITTIKMEVFIRSLLFFRFSIENSWHFWISVILWQSCIAANQVNQNIWKKIRINIFICQRSSDVIGNHSEEQPDDYCPDQTDYSCSLSCVQL